MNRYKMYFHRQNGLKRLLMARFLVVRRGERCRFVIPPKAGIQQEPARRVTLFRARSPSDVLLAGRHVASRLERCRLNPSPRDAAGSGALRARGRGFVAPIGPHVLGQYRAQC